jgi:RimJ/RimL family protein N-acetyltransferase
VKGSTPTSVAIAPLKPEHFALVARWLAQPDLARWLTSDWRAAPAQPTTIAMCARQKRSRLFLISSDGEPCGLVALADLDAADGTGMVWYALGDAALAGRGIASAAVRELVAIAFGELGLRSVYAWIMEDNVASRRVLLRAGFREAGRIRQATVSGERRVDRVYFDLIADGTDDPPAAV